MSLLLSKNANVELATIDKKRTALHEACYHGHPHVRLCPWTPSFTNDSLFSLAYNDVHQVVTTLLTAHAKVSAVDKWEQTPLHLAGRSSSQLSHFSFDHLVTRVFVRVQLSAGMRLALKCCSLEERRLILARSPEARPCIWQPPLGKWRTSAHNQLLAPLSLVDTKLYGRGVVQSREAATERRGATRCL
jgi:hypothetical protein